MGTISAIGTPRITLGAEFTMAGAFAFTGNLTGITNVTFPTSGTLATTSGTIASIAGTANQVLVNGTVGTPQTGAVTLTLPQSIATTSSPTFAALTLTTPLTPGNGGTGHNNGSKTISLDSPTTGYVLTSDVSGNATYQSNPGSTAIQQINGNSGSASGTIVNLLATIGCGASVSIIGGGNELDFSLSDTAFNTFLGGSTGPGSPDTYTFNTCLGSFSMVGLTSGSYNACLGSQSLASLTSGSSNIAMGDSALSGIVSGTYNISLGDLSGNALASSESSNIYLNTPGVLAESHVLRIGKATGSGDQELNKAFICGINGVNVGSVASVVSISGNQLGSTTITAGSGISITPAANTITIASSGGGLAWVSIAGTSQSAAVNTAYLVANAAQTTINLPAVAPLGSTIRVYGLGSGGWILRANTGQVIRAGSSVSSSAGSLTSSNQYDCVEVSAIVANSVWMVGPPNSMGLTIA